jgi:hypothetical protein
VTYDQHILGILSGVGQRGISVMSLAKHVYNQNNTFFGSPDFNAVYVYVQQYLRRNSKSPQSLVEHTQRRGYYRLNTRGNADARQIMIDFRKADEEEDDNGKPPPCDLSLDLFADDFS